MDKPRPCGCKGCRTCLICEDTYNIGTKTFDLKKDNGTYVYCALCNLAFPGWHCDEWLHHPHHSGSPIEYPGVYIQLDFLNAQEETELMNGIDSLPWDLSQSGRRKQNYGPKCNFRKRKLRLGDFSGFPGFSRFVQEKFEDVPVLQGFRTIEQCSLEYDPSRGASIDPHIDDCWIWGERIITVNLLADSVLTMTYNEKLAKYNLDCVEAYPAVLTKSGEMNDSENVYGLQKLEGMDWPVVRIPMPRRSLLVMYGSARYDWEHQVLREDIFKRRVCLAYREFTPPYLPNGEKHHDGIKILETAAQFWTSNTAII